MRFKTRFRGDDGFTLAEMLVVVCIMVIFLVGVGGMISSAVKSSVTSYNLVKSGENASEAMSVMVRQIRLMSALGPVTSTASVIRFAGDIKGDDTLTTVQYEVANGYLRRGYTVFGSGEPAMEDWIEGCEQVSFKYYYWYVDLDNDVKELRELVPASADWNNRFTEICKIDISLRMTENNEIFRTSVRLRNQLQSIF